MLTNKYIVETLEAVGYSDKEIIEFAFISEEELEKIKNDE